MITKDLYKKSTLIEFSDNTKLLERIPYNPNQQSGSGDIVYTVIEGQNLTSIAYKFYGEPLYWYIIADMNNIINPFDLPIGMKLVIPNLDKFI